MIHLIEFVCDVHASNHQEAIDLANCDLEIEWTSIKLVDNAKGKWEIRGRMRVSPDVQITFEGD